MIIHQWGRAIQAELGTVAVGGHFLWVCYSGIGIVEIIAISQRLPSVIIVKIQDRDVGLC